MPKQRMTEAWLRQLAARPPERREDWIDTGQRLPGMTLMLRNGPGRMTWALRYRPPESTTQRMLRIGCYPLLKLDEARALHRRNAAMLLENIDPAGDVEHQSDVPTLAEVMVDFIEHCRSPKSAEDARPRVKSWAGYASKLGVKTEGAKLSATGGLYTPKEWLEKRITEITPRMIRQAADRILQERGHATVNAWQTVFSSMLSHAVRRGWIEVNPAKGIPHAGKKTVNRKVLDVTKLCAILRAAENFDHSTVQAVRWMILTGQRAETIVQAKWEQIEDSWWRIPFDELKGGRGDHLVYLGTPMARELLDALRVERSNPTYLFHNSRTRERLTGAKSLRDAVVLLRRTAKVPEFTIRLCRPSAATLMTETGVELQHVSLALDHAVPGVPAITRKHYVNNAEFRDKIQAAFEAYHGALAEHLNSQSS